MSLDKDISHIDELVFGIDPAVEPVLYGVADLLGDTLSGGSDSQEGETEALAILGRRLGLLQRLVTAKQALYEIQQEVIAEFTTDADNVVTMHTQRSHGAMHAVEAELVASQDGQADTNPSQNTQEIDFTAWAAAHSVRSADAEPKEPAETFDMAVVTEWAGRLKPGLATLAASDLSGLAVRVAAEVVNDFDKSDATTAVEYDIEDLIRDHNLNADTAFIVRSIAKRPGEALKRQYFYEEGFTLLNPNRQEGGIQIAFSRAVRKLEELGLITRPSKEIYSAAFTAKRPEDEAAKMQAEEQASKEALLNRAIEHYGLSDMAGSILRAASQRPGQMLIRSYFTEAGITNPSSDPSTNRAFDQAYKRALTRLVSLGLIGNPTVKRYVFRLNKFDEFEHLGEPAPGENPAPEDEAAAIFNDLADQFPTPYVGMSDNTPLAFDEQDAAPEATSGSEGPLFEPEAPSQEELDWYAEHARWAAHFEDVIGIGEHAISIPEVEAAEGDMDTGETAVEDAIAATAMGGSRIDLELDDVEGSEVAEEAEAYQPEVAEKDKNYLEISKKGLGVQLLPGGWYEVMFQGEAVQGFDDCQELLALALLSLQITDYAGPTSPDVLRNRIEMLGGEYIFGKVNDMLRRFAAAVKVGDTSLVHNVNGSSWELKYADSWSRAECVEILGRCGLDERGAARFLVS